MAHSTIGKETPQEKPPHENTGAAPAPDQHTPRSGRTTLQGRRAEKPLGIRPAGPSGQRDQSKHDQKHANR